MEINDGGQGPAEQQSTDPVVNALNNAGSQEQSNSGEATPQGNPAWQPLLQQLPDAYHHLVTPHLKQWDQNFQTELQKVQSQYEPFAAFKDQNPEDIQRAIGLYELANSNPEYLFNQMKEYYGFGGDQGQQVDQQQTQVSDDDFDINGGIENDPKFKEVQGAVNSMAEMFIKQHEQEQMRQAEQQLQVEIDSIKANNPGMTEDDEVMIYRIAAANNMSLTDAAAELTRYTEAAVAARQAPAAPSVMSANGAVPDASTVDPRKLDSRGTRSLVENILRQQN